ncbi:MAG: carboxypeptidase-like regulatory domain-containing protein, partial [Planctomycetota bacterium]
MRSILLLVAVLAVAGLGWLFFSSSSTDEPLPPAVEPAAKAPAVSVPDAAAGVVAADAATNAASQTPATNPVRTDVTGTETAAAAVVVRGRLVDSAGAPRAGIALGWRSWRSGDFEMEFAASETVGRGREALDGTSTTGADGRFSFALPKGRSGRVTLTTSELLLRRGHGRFSTERGDADLGDVVALRPAVVRGVVTDDKGQPQEGVTVGADTTRLGIGLEHEVKTDALGAFAMAGLQEGVWHLRTLSPRFLPATLEVQLKDEEQKDGVAIQLLRGNAIAGQVVDDRGLPVAGAKVGCMRREKSGAMTIARFAEDEATTTDGNGWFTLAGLSGDTATVRATHRQHDRAMADDVVVGTGNLVLRLSRLATIRGVLKDATGKPLAGSIVSARRAAESGPVLAEHGDSASGALMSDFDVDFDLGEVAEGELEQMARTRPGQALTAKDGSFEIDTVRPGPVNVRARGKAHRPTERKGLNVAPAQVLEGIQLVADVGAVAVVHVVDEKGEPVAGAEVVLARPAERQDGAMMVRSEMRVGSDAGDAVHIAGMGDEFGKAKTDEQGLARIAGLPAGAAEARGSHERFAPSSPVNTTLPQHGEVEVKVVLRTPGSARLSTTDTNGVGIAADYVVRGPLGEPGTDDRRGTTGGDGIGKVEQLAPGRYHAELRKKSRGQSFGDSGSMVFMAADSDQGMRSSRVEFEVTAGGVADVSLRVPTMATVRGRVTGTSGPVANVRVGLSKRSEPDAPGAHGMAEIPGFGEESGSTNAAGDYELRDLEPGRYRLTWGMADQLVKEHQDL